MRYLALFSFLFLGACSQIAAQPKAEPRPGEQTSVLVYADSNQTLYNEELNKLLAKGWRVKDVQSLGVVAPGPAAGKVEDRGQLACALVILEK